MDHLSFIEFIKSKQFRFHLKVALAIFSAIILFSSLFLKIITRHNQALCVPNFKGLSYVEAEKIADEYNMHCVLSDSVYNLTLPPGKVVEQEPKEGSKVKSGRRIFLIMNAIIPEKVKMPNVIGVSLRQASAILESNGLSKVTTYSFS